MTLTTTTFHHEISLVAISDVKPLEAGDRIFFVRKITIQDVHGNQSEITLSADMRGDLTIHKAA